MYLESHNNKITFFHVHMMLDSVIILSCMDRPRTKAVCVGEIIKSKTGLSLSAKILVIIF